MAEPTSPPDDPTLAVPYSPFDPSLPATIPAALAWMPPNTVDDGSAAEMTRLATTFLERVEGGTDDPLNPAYQEEWVRAQEESDARMRASLGGQAWLNHHREAHQHAAQQAQETEAPGASR